VCEREREREGERERGREGERERGRERMCFSPAADFICKVPGKNKVSL
jgi:hypothetical protein